MAPQFRTPFAAAQTSAPMFGRSAEPAYPNPLQGFPGTANAPAMQMLLPLLMQQVGKQYGMVPGQFQPTQNMFDQMQAQQYHQQQALSMQAGQRHDAGQMQQIIQGAMKTMQRDPLTRQQQQQAASMAGQVQQFLPMLAAVVGPEMADSLFGATGSATLLSQSIHRGMRNTQDPVTRAGRTSGASANFISDEVFQRLYGAGAKPGNMAGVSAGQAGAMFEELQARGIMRMGGGQQERLNEVARMDFSKVEQRRMAEGELRSRGQEVSEESIGRMQSTMFEGPGSTLGRMQGGGDSAQTLQGLSGADTLMRAGDAQRISKRLQDMSGAVTAMREIFGDMGNANAPMSEIINGLDALTQGKFATMSPASVEQMVRTTRNLARSSGMGMEAMMEITGGIAQQMQGLGGSRSAVPFLAQQTAAGSIGFDRAGMGRITGEGALNRQQATMLEARLGAGAAASQQANAQFAILRMERELGGQLPKDSKMAAVAAAIREGRDTVSYKDPTTGKMVTEKLEDMDLSNGDVADMAASAGINKDVARSYLADRTGNSDEINTAGGRNAINNARSRQLRSDMAPLLAQAFASPLFSMINDETAIGKSMNAAGVKMGHEERMALGHRMVEDFFKMSTETMEDPQKRRAAMRTNARNAIEATMRQQLQAQGVAPEEIENRIRRLRPQLTDEALDQMVAAQHNLGNNAIAKGSGGRFSGLKGLQGAFQMLSPEAQAARGKAQFEQENEARIQAAFGRIGTSGPVARVVDALKNAQPGEDLGRLAAKAMGFVDEKEINAILDTGPLRAIRDLQDMQGDSTTLTGEAMRDDKGNLTAAGERHQALTAEFAEGMNTGGKESDEALQKAAEAFGLKDPAELSKMVEGKLSDKNLDPAERKRMERLKRLITVTQGAKGGDTVVSQLAKMQAAKRAEKTPIERAGEAVSDAAADAVKTTDSVEGAGKAGEFNKEVSKDEKQAARSGKMALSGELRIVGLDKALLTGVGVEGDHENNGVATQVIAPASQST